MLPELSVGQFSLVANFLSFAIATLGAAAIFYFISPGVNKRYRLAVVVSGLVCLIATYHYFRIYDSFVTAYALEGTGNLARYVASGTPFNDFYRYADWFITVPLLMVELVAVLALARSESRTLLTKLVVATALMIALGYPGEVSSDAGTRWIFWTLSMIPFIYTLYVLFIELGKALERQPAEVRGLISTARVVILVTWMFYPIAFAIKTLTGTTAEGEVAIQIGYSIADVTAKAGYGLVIYFIARRKSELEEEVPGSSLSDAALPA
ncbi:MAG: bacteriorhodopsin [Acidobacteria bacterium]|nr:bacteriorhodopsin [Acidobacteriota bacterium]